MQAEALSPETIYRFVLGLDRRPSEMTSDEVRDLLQDPFGKGVISRGRFPLTLKTLLSEFDQPQSALPLQESFVVADGGQIPWSIDTQGVNRNIRFAISRSDDQGEGVLISTGTQFESESQFLQLLAWDSANKVFNYYERRAGTWIWAGNSYHALREPTRGKGPFDSHVNGSLVMKELKLPWTHWHSMASVIADDVLAPDDPLRSEPLWRTKSGADDFEIAIVRPGIRKWTAARVAKFISEAAEGLPSNPHELMRHLFESTTVNLVASNVQSRSVIDQTQVKLPLTFFLNSDVLIELLGLEPDIDVPTVSGEFYRKNLEAFEFKLITNGFQRNGDTHFAFIIPEPAFEDHQVVAEMLRRSLITPRFVACVSMVDFANPVSSVSRQHLLQYVPSQVHQDFSNLESQFVTNVETAVIQQITPHPASPELQFLNHWQLGTAWKTSFEARIEAYFSALKQRLQSQAGYDACVHLAESRRREFRRRPLSEFDLTLPVTNIPADAPLLQMFEDGSVGNKPGTQPCHFRSLIHRHS